MSLLRAPRHTAAIFRGIRGNARPLLLFEPLFIVPFSLYGVYASLYMRELGLSAQQIGFLTSASTASFIVFSFMAGHLVDRSGRRRTTLVFDLVSWSSTMLIWAAAQNFWHFLLATIVNGLQAVSATSWSCWLVEDYAPEERMPIFTALQMISPLAAFATPIGGWLVRRYGIVPGTRLLYLFAFVCMTTMFFGRNHCTTETRVGESLRRSTEDHTVLKSMGDYWRSLRLLAANRTALAYFILTGMLWFRDSLIAPFNQLLLVDRLGMAEGLLALFPAIGGLATIVTLIYLLPLLVGHERTGVTWGLLLSAASIAVLLRSPAGNVALVSLSTLLGAAGLAVLNPALNTGWNNSLGDEERAKVFAMSFVFWSVAKLPAGYIGGALYHQAPIWPFVTCLVILFMGLPLPYFVTGGERARKTPAQEL